MTRHGGIGLDAYTAIGDNCKTFGYHYSWLSLVYFQNRLTLLPVTSFQLFGMIWISKTIDFKTTIVYLADFLDITLNFGSFGCKLNFLQVCRFNGTHIPPQKIFACTSMIAIQKKHLNLPCVSIAAISGEIFSF